MVKYRKAGLSLVETMVAVSIMAMMFSTLGYLLIVTSRNTMLVREQSRSQSQAAAAGERITNLVRNASLIKPYGADDTATTLSRILYEYPDPTVHGVTRTGAIAFVPPSATGESNGTIKVFLNSSDYSPSTVTTKKADYQYDGIQTLAINYRTSTWMSMRVFYSYRSYQNFAAKNNEYNLKLAGEFVTDVIAKNHHPGESAHYAETTSSIFLL